jgi:hypothetical protein
MNEALDVADINARFDSEWVLLDDPKVDATMRVTGGKVVWHSPNRDEVYRKAIELHLPHTAILYTGSVPDDVAVVL